MDMYICIHIMDRQLDCSQFWTISNKDASTSVYKSLYGLPFHFPWWYLGNKNPVEWLIHMVHVPFFFKLLNCFPKLHCFVFPAVECENLNCAISLLTLNMVSLLNFSYSDRYIVVFIVTLICIFLLTNGVEHLFMYILLIFYWIVCYLLSLESSLYILDAYTLSETW